MCCAWRQAIQMNVVSSASFDVMKCRHINIVFRVELQVSDYTSYLCILVHHIIWEMWIKFPQIVLLSLIPCFFIYPMPATIDISPKCMMASLST